ncbi:MAG: acetylglutamate kinase [Chloroflexi bacterium]|nr:acetylglutamate kinase [Chloroflexota bacterium]
MESHAQKHSESSALDANRGMDGDAEGPDTSGYSAHRNEDNPAQNPARESQQSGTIVVKIGGSTLGGSDTTLQDLVELQRQGMNPVVVHGGGKIISEWMEKQGVRPKFVRGLRVTDEPSLDIVVAVLTGLINKNLVASLVNMGARAIGISGADDGMLRAEVKDSELGLVGRVVAVNTDPIKAVMSAGCIPVIAPVAMLAGGDSTDGNDFEATLLNINADTAAGEIAFALSAERLVFLTDVDGVLDTSHRLIPRLTERQAIGLIRSNVAAGGMIPKLEACVTALKAGGIAQIVDGRKPLALKETVAGKTFGTRVG